MGCKVACGVVRGVVWCEGMGVLKLICEGRGAEFSALLRFSCEAAW